LSQALQLKGESRYGLKAALSNGIPRARWPSCPAATVLLSNMLLLVSVQSIDVQMKMMNAHQKDEMKEF